MIKKITYFLIAIAFVFIFSCMNETPLDNSIKITTSSLRGYKCLFFFIPDCPVCINNLSKIIIIQEHYKSLGLYIDAIYSDQYADTNQLNKMIKEYKFDIPVTIDSNLILAKKYNIKVVPQFILIDSMGSIIYNGMIDNYFYSLGKHRNIVSETYLENAIEAVIKNKNSKIQYTIPIGCKINYQLHIEK